MFLLQRVSKVKKCLSFPILFKYTEKTESDTEKNIPYGRKMYTAVEVKQNLFKLRSPEHAQNCMKSDNSYLI